MSGNPSDRDDEIERDLEARQIEAIRRLAGECFAELISSADSVARLAHHPEPKVRAAAILSGYAKWKQGNDPSFQNLCLRLAAYDRGEARDMGVAMLACIFYGSKSLPVQRVLTPIVRDASESNEVRNVAYRALREIEFGFEYETVLDSTNESRAMIEGRPVALTSIDWALLDRIDASLG